MLIDRCLSFFNFTPGNDMLFFRKSHAGRATTNQPPSRDSIHERIELRPDGSRSSFYHPHSQQNPPKYENYFRVQPSSNLQRSDSIR